MSRVYVTGAEGMLGKALVPLFRKHYEVRGSDLPLCDIRDPEQIMRDITDFSPEYVIHLASMTDVDGCELHPEEARRTNVDGTRNVALAARECGAVMVYISTGMIYRGDKKSPYVETDPPNPVNIYGKTKFQGEHAMREILSNFFIFNTCWVFGGGRDDKKFVPKIIELARNNRELKVVDDKFGSPTYTVDLAGAILDFMESEMFGRYHCVNKGCVNRYQLASKILEVAGIDTCRLIPVSSDEFPLPAPRPRMEAMVNHKFELIGLDPMRNWDEAIGEYVKTLIR